MKNSAPAKRVYGTCSAVPVNASTSPSPLPPLPELLASVPRTDVGSLVVVVESPGFVVVVEPSGLEVDDVLEELDVLEVLDDVLEELDVDDVVEELEVVVAVVEKVIGACAPVVRSLGSSATRMVHAFWMSHATLRLGPSPANTVKVSEPVPAAFVSDTVTVRKSQSVAGFVGAALHCSITGLKFGVRPVQETVTVAPSVKPVFGVTVTEPFAPPTPTKKRLGINSAAPSTHRSAAARPKRRRAA